MISPNAMLSEQCKIVEGLFAVVPSSSSPDIVSLKGYSRCMILISVKNATTVTGSAIALNQATDVSNTGGKALAFTTAYRNLDTAAADSLAAFTVSSNTFTTDNTNSKNLMYVIEVREEDLDTANNFDCLSVTTGNATAATVHVTYFLYPAKYGKVNPVPSAITN